MDARKSWEIEASLAERFPRKLDELADAETVDQVLRSVLGGKVVVLEKVDTGFPTSVIVTGFEISSRVADSSVKVNELEVELETLVAGAVEAALELVD